MASRNEAFGAASRGDLYAYEPVGLVLVEDESHPLYDERVKREPSKRLIKSIMKHGVLVPIVVRKNGVRKDGTPIVEVVDGRQRVKASREANRQLVEAGQNPILIQAVYRKPDDEASADCMILVNEHRSQDDIVTKAEKLQRYLDRGRTEEDAKLTFAISSRELTRLSRVLDMGADLKTALQSKTVTMEIALRLSELPRQDQPAALQKVLEGGTGRGRQAAEAAEKAVGKKPGPRIRTAKTMASTIEMVGECLAAGEYKKGVLDALQWALGGNDAAWAEPKKAQKKPREKRT